MSQNIWEEKRFEETEEGYEFSLIGQKVILIQFGCFNVDLGLSSEHLPHIRLGMPFVHKREGENQVLDPENVLLMAPLLSLVGTSMLKVSATKRGFLSLAFSNGATIEAPVGDDYEAWQISDSQGFLAVCAIGGEVFFFLPEDRVTLNTGDNLTLNEQGQWIISRDN